MKRVLESIFKPFCLSKRPLNLVSESFLNGADLECCAAYTTEILSFPLLVDYICRTDFPSCTTSREVSQYCKVSTPAPLYLSSVFSPALLGGKNSSNVSSRSKKVPPTPDSKAQSYLRNEMSDWRITIQGCSLSIRIFLYQSQKRSCRVIVRCALQDLTTFEPYHAFSNRTFYQLTLLCGKRVRHLSSIAI